MSQKQGSFDDGYAAALNAIEPLFSDWDRLSDDQRRQIWTIAPALSGTLERLKASVDRS